MSQMEWNDSYTVSLAAFDNQHKQLFKYFNELFDAMSQGHGQDVLHEVLEKTCKYAQTHFQEEERWMKAHQYPGMAEHCEEHRKFAEQAALLLAESRSGKMVMSSKVSRMLREWLTNHIMVTDKKYAEFAVAKGIKV